MYHEVIMVKVISSLNLNTELSVLTAVHGMAQQVHGKYVCVFLCSINSEYRAYLPFDSVPAPDIWSVML